MPKVRYLRPHRREASVKRNDNAKAHVSTGMAARLLGVSVQTVRRWCNGGKLTAKRNPITGYRYISVESIRKLLRKHGGPDVELSADVLHSAEADTFFVDV